MTIPEINGVSTPLGNLVTEVSRDTGHVTVTMKPRDGVSLRHSVVSTDGAVSLDMWDGPKPPKVGQEVHINGTSVSVDRVADDPDGVWVWGDDGKKYKWDEE